MSCTKTIGPILTVTDNDKSSAVAEMGDRLATIDMADRKVAWGGVALSVGEMGHHLIQCRLGPGLPPHQVTS